MKAYVVFCTDDDHGAKVTFAKSSRLADRRANCEICDCEWIDIRVKRSPEFDKYAPGPVTAAQYIAEGWFKLCGYCERQVYSDDGAIFTDDDHTYCSQVCLQKLLASHKAIGPNAHQTILDSVASMERYLKGSRS